MSDSSNPSIPYQIFMLFLCLFVIGLLVVDTTIQTDTETKRILLWIDNGICVIFLLDFLGRLITEKNRLTYLVTWGWIDFVSSLPMFAIARLGRIARILRIIRLIRGLKSFKTLLDFIVQKRGESTFLSASLVAILTISFGSISILQCEKGIENSNIQSAGDAVWWTIVTMSTVGYGDYFPVTPEGRIIAAILMIVGIGLFGTFTGLFAAWLIEGKKENKNTNEQNH
jgi:voltage-gated potassium channel